MTPRTLRGRLYLLLVQWLLVFLAVSGLLGFVSVRHLRRHIEHDRLLLARTVAHHLDAILLGALQRAARLEVELPADPAEWPSRQASSHLRTFRFQTPFRHAVHLIGPDGAILVSDPPFAGAPPARAATAGGGRPSIGGLLTTAGGDRPILLLTYPFERSSAGAWGTYRLVAEMSPRGSLLSGTLQDLAPEAGLHLVVIDRSARVIAAPDSRQLDRVLSPAGPLTAGISRRQPVVAESEVCTVCPEPETGSFLTVAVPLRYAPWAVAIQQDRAAAFEVLRFSEAGFVATAALLAVAALLLSRGLGRSVLEPIGRLSAQAERLREGDLATPITVSGDRELQVLAGSLDEARRRLGASLAELTGLNQQLEVQVASRTRDLRSRWEDLQLLHAQRKLLVRRLLAAAEEERRRIARELHDEIAQLLTAIQLSLQRAAQRPDEPGHLERAEELLVRTQQEVHRVIFDLRPSLLDDLGLAAAVRWYAERYLERQGLGVELQIDPDLEEAVELPPEVEIAAFRICQEIVTNILRHARAEQVSIELEHAGGRLTLSVEDDGVGFDPASAATLDSEGLGGAGLAGMRERAELVGGTLTIESEPGLGTHVRLEIPLDGGDRPRELEAEEPDPIFEAAAP
jgi:signal transduction histidine kinase